MCDTETLLTFSTVECTQYMRRGANLRKSSVVLSGTLLKLLAAAPPSLARSLEEGSRLAQGKGGGGATLGREVAAGLSLLPPSIRHNPVTFDVGANVGDWTAALLRRAPQASVTCFEPSQAAFSQLSERFAGNARVDVVQLAVGKDSGVARLWANEPGSGLASLTRRRLDHFDLDFSHSEDVTVTSLDDWCLGSGVTPQFLKLDVEGHELEALSGATATVSRSLVVQFEFGGCNIDTRTYFQDFFYYFKEVQFDLFRLAPRGLLPISNYREIDEAFVTTNYFAARKIAT
jgi:FkbM family methyltransferase